MPNANILEKAIIDGTDLTAREQAEAILNFLDYRSDVADDKWKLTIDTNRIILVNHSEVVFSA